MKNNVIRTTGLFSIIFFSCPLILWPSSLTANINFLTLTEDTFANDTSASFSQYLQEFKIQADIKFTDTFYFNKDLDTCDRNDAKTQKVIHYMDTFPVKKAFVESYHLIQQSLNYIESYGDLDKRQLHGIVVHYYSNQRIKYHKSYDDGKLHGVFKSYYLDGSLKRWEEYDSGVRTYGTCYTQNGEEIAFFEYEKLPEFPGGNDQLMLYIAKNFKYPSEARKKDISGRMLISFVVNEDGTISDVFPIKKVHPLLDDEAMRVVKSMPQWIPGSQDGVPVKVRFSIPIVASLD
jgi:periplasmic protein TonB